MSWFNELKNLTFSENELYVYLTLLKYGPCTAEEVLLKPVEVRTMKKTLM